MNQDLRRMAEELLRDCVWFPTLDKGMLVRVDDAKEAIAAALVKVYGEQEPVKVYLVATGEVHQGQETYTRHDVCPPLCEAETLYTHPIPSQQEERTAAWNAATDKVTLASVQREERKPLSADELADRCERWLAIGVPATNIVDAFERGFRDAETAHNIKEQQ